MKSKIIQVRKTEEETESMLYARRKSWEEVPCHEYLETIIQQNGEKKLRNHI